MKYIGGSQEISLSTCNERTDGALFTFVARGASDIGISKKTRGGSALCARGRTGHARHPYWGESPACMQLICRESSACT